MTWLLTLIMWIFDDRPLCDKCGSKHTILIASGWLKTYMCFDCSNVIKVV